MERVFGGIRDEILYIEQGRQRTFRSVKEIVRKFYIFVRFPLTL